MSVSFNFRLEISGKVQNSWKNVSDENEMFSRGTRFGYVIFSSTGVS